MARALLLLLAAAALGLAVARGGDDRACQAAQRDAFAIGLGGASLDAGAVAARAEAGCTGGAPLASAATGLLRGRRLDDALGLVRAATVRDPEDARTWAVLAAVLRARGDVAGAVAARGRIATLSPPRPAPG